MQIKKVGIIGQGLMGSGIAQVMAQSGYEITVFDSYAPCLAGAYAKLEKSYGKAVDKGRMTKEEADAALANVTVAERLEDVAGSDMVIEVIVENIELKKQLFKQLDGICQPDTIFASNTSSTCITEMAFTTQRPDKFIGMHFFNPVPAMKLVEVIRGLATSDDTYNTIRELAVSLEKDPVEVKDNPGFVVNRILIPMINEAVFVLQDGVASAEDIDKALKLGANHPLGPLALADLIGLDTCLSIMDVLYMNFGDSKYRAAYLLRKMVKGGKLGRKSGEGFFSYSK